MVAIAPSVVSLFILFLPTPAGAQANQNDTSNQGNEARAVLGYVADALTAGNASDAMTQFEKSFPDYQKLNNYFAGLTHAFYISSEVTVLDEDDKTDETKLSIRWSITLSDLQTHYAEHRSAELDVRLVRKNGKWKIAHLSPSSFFDPANTSTSSGPSVK